MSRGASGRIVVEVEPALKQRLYVELSRDGLTLKDWLITQATRYIADNQQPQLFVTEARTQSYPRQESQ
jgi:hypothetical protein